MGQSKMENQDYAPISSQNISNLLMFLKRLSFLVLGIFLIAGIMVNSTKKAGISQDIPALVK